MTKRFTLRRDLKPKAEPAPQASPTDSNKWAQPMNFGGNPIPQPEPIGVRTDILDTPGGRSLMEVLFGNRRPRAGDTIRINRPSFGARFLAHTGGQLMPEIYSVEQAATLSRGEAIAPANRPNLGALEAPQEAPEAPAAPPEPRGEMAQLVDSIAENLEAIRNGR